MSGSRWTTFWVAAAGLGGIAAVITLLISFGHSGTSPSPGPSPSSSTITSPTATALGTATSSESTPPPIYYQGSVGITSNGLNFDSKPLSAGPGAGSFYYNTSALETGGSTTDGLAVWTQGGTPTAAECKTFASTHLTPDIPNIVVGMKICFKTDQGRFGFLRVQPGTSANELNAIATVWGS